MTTKTKSQSKANVVPHDVRKSSPDTTIKVGVERHDTPSTREKDAAELFAAGKRILAGEKPSAVFPQSAPAAAPKAFLPAAVERIAAAVSNILTFGAGQDDLERIILATVSQEVRNYSYSHADRELEQTVADSQRRQLPRMLQDLADFRHKTPTLGGKPVPETSAIGELIRQNSRHQCAREFEGFLHDAHPGEIRFLSNVLTCQSGNGSYRHELAIATAFFDEIDRDIQIFRVSTEHAKAVDAYIEALAKSEVNA